MVQLNDTFTMNELTDRIIRLCNSRGDEYSRLGYLQNLSLLVNKFLQSNEFIEEKLKLTFENILNISKFDSVLSQDQIESFEVIVWILKSLILKIDTLGIEYINRLISLLSLRK